MSRVARPSSWRSISTSTAAASSADVVTRQAGELGPCSAWASRSAATISARGGVVGDDRHLGRTGEYVDADLPVELAFRLGDVRVPGADDHVGGLAVEQAEGHRREGLHPAEGEDPLGARRPRGVEHGRVRLALARGRGAAHDVGHAGGAGHPDGHERAGQQREAAGREVGADVVDRDVLLAADHPGNDLGLEVGQVRPLHLGEAAGALRPGVEGGLEVVRQVLGERGELVAGDLEVLAAGPAVEPLGVPAYGGQSVPLDLGQHGRHGLADLRIGLGGHVRSGGFAYRRDGAAEQFSVPGRKVHTYKLG